MQNILKGKGITPWSTVLLEKLMVCHPVNKFTTFYGT
jgi:hypothetical protein